MNLLSPHIIVTAGPTHEPIDPVRYLANRSSGKQGFAIAGALAAKGARVTLIAGPVVLATPPGVTRIDVETALEMAAAVEAALPADAAIMVAAVADWRVQGSDQKIKKDGSGAPPTLTLIENPDILAGLCRNPRRPQLVVGFAAETQNVIEHAQAKLARKGCDWIVANDVAIDKMGGEINRVHIVTAAGVESWDRMAKGDVAERLAERVVEGMALSHLDQAVFAVLKRRWQKVALVIVKAREKASLPDDEPSHELIADRILLLAEAGRIDSAGDVRKWRHSEVRILRELELVDDEPDYVD